MTITANMILLIVSVLLLAAAMFSYFGYLKISSALYTRLEEESNHEFDDSIFPDSPYVIKREYDSYHNTNKYRVYKGKYSTSSERFSSAKKAQKSMNELEQLEGYKRTRVV